MADETVVDDLSWDEYGIGRARRHVALFGTEIMFEFFAEDDAAPIVTPKMEAAARDVLALADIDLNRLKDLLWEEFIFAFVVTDFGIVPQAGETTFDGHRRAFRVRNRDEAWERCRPKRVQITSEADDLDGRYATLCIDTVTDSYINVIVKNGRIVDFDDDGTVLDWFEIDDIHAQKARRAILVRELTESGLETMLAAGNP